ncbi:MAG TPA: adenosine deaminase [Usitatibacter sp.]|nr:adenosine deaminase [Usitatibacter sp.]
MRKLPKALLHEHLDGGLRPATLLELCHSRAIAVPARTPGELARWMHDNANAGSLERYLKGFAITIAAMASAAACERVAFEAAEDAAADGCVLAEFRMAPLLLEPHGLAGEAVMEAILAGLARSGLRCGLIVCGMRTENPQDSLRAARLAIAYADRGVVGFDLAGAEKYFPPGDHAAAMALAGEAGLGLTCHAGESDRGERVLEAGELGATRIGHGIHIVLGDTPEETRQWVGDALAMDLHFEVCPSSNLHTGAVRSIAEHPIRAMVDAGLSVSCSTDNRLMSGVTLSGELEALHREAGFTHAELAQLMRAGAEASFLPRADREAALREIEAGWRLS